MTTEFTGYDSEVVDSWRALNPEVGSYQPKKLPAAKPVAPVPARAGTGERSSTSSGTSGGVDMTLMGPRTYTSTDGVLVLSFPDTAEAVIGEVTVLFPILLETT